MITAILTAGIFILEGVGNIFPRSLTPFLYVGLLGFFTFYLIVKKKLIVFPLLPSVFFSSFLILSFISAVFYSVDKQISFELTIFYASCYLIFIFFYNHKDLARKYLIIIIITGSLILTATYLVNTLLKNNIVNEYQLVSSYFNNSHNHLGDFLGLGLIAFFYYLVNNEKKRSYWLILFFPIFLLSFSRSAFLALIVIYFIILIKSKIKKLFDFNIVLGLILIALAMIFFFSTVSEIKGRGLTGKINQYLTSNYELKTKEFTAGRITYLKQGLTGFFQQPFFGVGPGNFGFLSRKYVSPSSQWYDFQSTDTVHSIFPEILFENGLLAVIFFVGFIFSVVIYIFKKNQLENYLALYLLFIFQTDYSYRIYSMFVLFMVLLAVIYEGKDIKNDNKIIYFSLSAIMLIVVEFILASQILLKLNNPNLSLIFYPLNKEAYSQVISKESKNNCIVEKKYAERYYFVSPDYLPTLQSLSSYYKACGDKETAIKMLDRAIGNNRFINFEIVKENYILKKTVYGKSEASNFLFKVLKGYDALKYVPSFSRQVADFCKSQSENFCEKARWQ